MLFIIHLMYYKRLIMYLRIIFKKTVMNNNMELILSLIKADLINSRLIAGLQKAGLVVEDFYLDISVTVLKLMDFEDNDEDLNDIYIITLDRLVQEQTDDFRSRKNELAIELYTELLAEKKLRERVRAKDTLHSKQ